MVCEMYKLYLHICVLINFVFPMSCAKHLEHNFSRPWLNVKGSLTYENMSTLWNMLDEVLPGNALPVPIQNRQDPSGCNTVEIQHCEDPTSCFLNRLPEDPLNLYAVSSPTNRAHYRCRCKQNIDPVDYLETIHNSSDHVSIEIHTRCPRSPPCEKCDKEHTIKCLDLGGGKATCICDPDYMEDKNCARKKDGCTEPHPAATLTGKQACLADGTTNNSCFPIPQSLRYSCLCREPYREDKRLSFPNCMDNRTTCTRPLCLGFQPPPAQTIPGPSIVLDESHGIDLVDSEDCNQTNCECPDGWLGPHCTEKRGEPVLGSWSPWSTCSPDCIMPNERSRYQREEDLHAGNSRTTAIGYRSKFGRCTMSDLDFCVGTYRFWRRCRVTTLCNSWTNSRLSTVVNEAIGQAMIEHDKIHRPDRVEPILTVAAELTPTEKHCLNFIAVAGTLILSCISIWIMEIHHMIMHWNWISK
ncbi:hypothetical protein EG68_12334 [Paragonimus skrjabini miyazakii]|uniref:EGF-like domain-containing protein n=1 Tax=Paragonimus skrjabini miyazakii TaxID=59628 RepID=A0A8S9YBV5_9TREM|nr:hypothetical protein EG68_12334 [Paragonimus skrjabini miyazakii]